MEETKTSLNEENKSLNQAQTPNKQEEKDKTFKTLKRIQSLLKKESALKKLCKQINIFILIYFIFSYKTKRSNERHNRKTM